MNEIEYYINAMDSFEVRSGTRYLLFKKLARVQRELRGV